MNDAYDWEIPRIRCEIKKSGARRVGLQFPEGLKDQGLSIARKLEEETGAEIIILTDPCYGGCDLPLHTAKLLGLDLVVHFGHTEYPI